MFTLCACNRTWGPASKTSPSFGVSFQLVSYNLYIVGADLAPTWPWVNTRTWRALAEMEMHFEFGTLRRDGRTYPDMWVWSHAPRGIIERFRAPDEFIGSTLVLGLTVAFWGFDRHRSTTGSLIICELDEVFGDAFYGNLILICFKFGNSKLKWKRNVYWDKTIYNYLSTEHT